MKGLKSGCHRLCSLIKVISVTLLLECHTSWHEGLEFSPWPGHGNSIFRQVILTYMSVFTEVLGGLMGK